MLIVPSLNGKARLWLHGNIHYNFFSTVRTLEDVTATCNIHLLQYCVSLFTSEHAGAGPTPNRVCCWLLGQHCILTYASVGVGSSMAQTPQTLWHY